MIIKSEEQLEELISDYHTKSAFVLDLETEGLDPYKAEHRLIGVALSTMDGETAYVPFRHKTGFNLPLYNLYKMAPLFANNKKMMIGHNIKFDMNFLEMDGLRVNNQIVDTMVMAHLANENERSFALKTLGDKYLGAGASDSSVDLGVKLKAMGLGKGQMDQLPVEDIAGYAEQDVNLTRQMFDLYSSDLKNQGLGDLYVEYGDYIKATAGMERIGLPYDKIKCSLYREAASEHVQKMAEEMKQYGVANPNSSLQIRKALGVTSSAKEVLETMQDNPLAVLIGAYRKWSKVINTYYDVFDEKHDHNCYIHASLNMTRVVTGRLSCSEPNLQALPKESDEYKVRDLITAPPGFTLVSLDCSQIELRFLAQYTQDPFLLDVYRRGGDIHTETANALHMPRDSAKRINFGIVYGLGATGLSEKLRIPMKQAQDYLSRYHKRIPGIKRLYYQCERMAKQNRMIEMWTGRIRHVDDVEEAHKAMSSLIQGGVGEMMRINITRLYHRLMGTRVRMLLQVHDEIVFLIPTDQLNYWVPEIKSIMEDFDFDIPIVSEGKYGPTWGQLKKWEGKVQ